MKRIYNITLILFAAFWIIIVFFDYWQKHPLYFHAIEKFKYIGLLIFYGLFIGATTFFLHSNIKVVQRLKKYVNWLSVLSTIILLMLISLFAYIKQVNILNLKINKIKIIDGIGIGNIFHFLGGFFTVFLATFFVVFTARLLGNLVCQLLELKNDKPIEAIVDISIGIMLITSLIFYLGVFSLLQSYILFPVFLLIILLNWKKGIEILASLIRPIKMPDNLNWMGGMAIAFMLIITAINFNQILRPIPTGFDALTTYVNLPRLLNDHGSLVSGYQPHNWSLFMSLGFILFNMTEVTLCLSLIGGLLSIAAMYYLGTHWLKINVNYVWLGLAAFYLTPTIVHQSSKELKVDLGLLFIQLSILIIFIIWYKKQKTSSDTEETTLLKDTNEEKMLKPKKITPTPYSFGFLNKIHQLKPIMLLQNSHYKYMIILGLLTGFALGIKLTSVFVMLAILSGIWILQQRTLGYFAIFFLSVFVLLLAKVDNTGGLRIYHLSASIVQWLCLVVGLVLLGIEFFNNRQLFTKKFFNSLIYGSIVVLSFMPWVAKNYYETNSTDVSVLLNGKHIGPPVSVEMLDKNWRKVKK